MARSDGRQSHALILQHQEDAPAGLLSNALDSAGLRSHVVRRDLGDPLPQPDEVAIAVSLGSEASANDPTLAWVATELEWLAAADRAGTAILGLCFGGQALALALGGEVRRATHPERGWVTIRSDEPELIAPGPWLTWHDDEIGLPPGAELIAQNDSGVQAYRLRAHLGLQFHPEVTPEIVESWVRSSDDQGLDAAAMLEGTKLEFPRVLTEANRLFRGFIDSVRRSR